MGLVTLTPPAVEPVLLADLKTFLRIDSGDTTNDTLLTSLNTAARVWAEAYTRRRFITQTLRLLADSFTYPVSYSFDATQTIKLPCPPVQSITTLQYFDANGNTVILNQGVDYIVDLQSNPARLTPPFGSSWPYARVIPNAVQITYVSGYGDAGTVPVPPVTGGPQGLSVPEGIKTGIKVLAGYWWNSSSPDENDIPKSVKAMLFPYRDLRL